MKKYLFILSALVLFAFTSCQKLAGDPVSQDFAVESAYTRLEVQDAFDVTVSDAVDVITITVGEKVMPYVVAEVVDSTLRIYLKSMGAVYVGEQKAVIPYNADLTYVKLSGSSSFHSTYNLDSENVKVKLSGSSEFDCDLAAQDKVIVDMSGSSKFTGNMVTVEADVELSGASNYNGDILAENLKIDLFGSSNIEGLVAANILDLILSGASDAKFSGDVNLLKINLDGSSNIVKHVTGNRYALGCGRCEGEMSGASDAYIHCNGNIKVDLSGASELHFTGSGNPADSSTSGSSEIIHDVLP